MQQRLDQLPDRLQHQRVFLATYRRMTAAVGEAIRNGSFEDPAFDDHRDHDLTTPPRRRAAAGARRARQRPRPERSGGAIGDQLRERLGDLGRRLRIPQPSDQQAPLGAAQGEPDAADRRLAPTRCRPAPRSSGRSARAEPPPPPAPRQRPRTRRAAGGRRLERPRPAPARPWRGTRRGFGPRRAPRGRRRCRTRRSRFAAIGRSPRPGAGRRPAPRPARPPPASPSERRRRSFPRPGRPPGRRARAASRSRTRAAARCRA